MWSFKRKDFPQYVLLIFFIISGLDALGQDAPKKAVKPGRMVIVRLDSLVVPGDLVPQQKGIEMGYRESYYNNVELLFELSRDNNNPYNESPEQLRKTKAGLLAEYEAAENKYPEIMQFRYYHSPTNIVCWGLYQKINSDSFNIGEIAFLPQWKNKLENISDSLKVDFVSGFDNVSINKENNQLLINAIFIVYSKKDQKIILQKEVSGNTERNVGEWRCNGELICLFKNLAKDAVYLALPLIKKEMGL